MNRATIIGDNFGFDEMLHFVNTLSGKLDIDAVLTDAMTVLTEVTANHCRQGFTTIKALVALADMSTATESPNLPRTYRELIAQAEEAPSPFSMSKVVSDPVPQQDGVDGLDADHDVDSIQMREISAMDSVTQEPSNSNSDTCTAVQKLDEVGLTECLQMREISAVNGVTQEPSDSNSDTCTAVQKLKPSDEVGSTECLRINSDSSWTLAAPVVSIRPPGSCAGDTMSSAMNDECAPERDQ